MNDNKNKQNNIQVAVRVRPLITRESGNEELWEVRNSKTICRKRSGSDKFHYDRVFDGTESNADVYNNLCRPLVEKVMEGFNATIFAYGQTSSGKTFTMMGEHNGITKGVVHYAITEIFEMIQKMTNREFLLRVSVLEIYNEKVYDLLSEKNEDLKLMDDCYGVLKINGLEERIVQTSDQIWDVMHEGQTKRRTGETQMNRVSSRSHFIFRMILESSLKNEEDPIVNVSQLNLVDLAGSENVKQTKSKGVRFKEGIHINLSLSTLSHLISQLSERPDQFINYRGSRLTRLLQNSLGGNAHTVIICTVTPTSLNETLSTLKFASTAKKIENKPEKNEILTDQALLKQYANKIKKLSEELKTTKQQGELELEEKKKQNETLKKQIEKLKANFVSQTSETKIKAIRRETWGGHLDRKRFIDPRNLNCYQLPNIDEEESENESELPDLMDPIKHRNSGGTSRLSTSSMSSIYMSKNIYKDIEVQTDNEFFEDNGDIDELMTIVSDLKSQLTTLQNEFEEHMEYTTYERQVLKAEHELQVENEALKAESVILRRKLESKSLLERSYFTSFNESKELECSLSKSEILDCCNSGLPNYITQDQFTQVTPIKLKEFSTQYCRTEVISEHSIQTSPIKLKDFSTQYCRNEVISEHSVQTSPIKLKEFTTQYCRNEVICDHSVQTSPIQLKEFSTQYCRNEVVSEHSVQTSPMNNLKSLSMSFRSEVTDESSVQTSPIRDLKTLSEYICEENLKVNQHSQVTDSFVEETNMVAKRKKSSELFHQSSQTTPVGAGKGTDLERNEVFIDNSLNAPKESEICECGYYSDEIKILVKKVIDLRYYACAILKNCVKVEYLKDADEYMSDVNDCCSKSALEKIADLENLISVLGYYISNRDQDCEIINNQLETKYQEINSLHSELSELKQTVNVRESELSGLRNLFFDLKQSFSKLTFLCQVLNNVDSQEKFAEIKERANMLIPSKPFKLEHEMTMFKNNTIKLNSYMEENASQIINLSEDLKKVKLELAVAQKEGLKLSESSSAFKNILTKSVQTVSDLGVTDIIEKDQVISALESEKKVLLEQVNSLEKRNESLKKEIDDIYNSDYERIEALEKEFTNTWKIKTEMLVKDLEHKYDQELIDQEKKFADELFEKVHEVKQENLKQLQELEEIKLSHNKELSAIKKQYEDQLASVYTEKDLLKHKLESEIEKRYTTFKEKYISKQKEFRNINSQLKVRLQHYIEEIEKLKNENTPSNQLQVIEKLKGKLNEISVERDLLQKKCTRADLQLSELKEHNNHLKHELKKIAEEEPKQSIQSKISKLEETNRELLYDLDQKKAKIMTLQSNNTSMLQELKKLKASVACKCKNNSKESNSDVSEKDEDKKERKSKMDCKSDLDSQEKTVAKKKLNDDIVTPQQNYPVNNKTPDQNALCVGGGSGPANIVKTYWLEGIVHGKDKEIRKLRGELENLKSQLKSEKLQPVIKEEKQLELKETEVRKREIAITPISPLQEVDENITVQLKSLHPYPGGVLPKGPRKHASREKNGGLTSTKPYDKHQNREHIKKENVVFNSQPHVHSNINKQELLTKKDVVNELVEPNCTQQ